MRYEDIAAVGRDFETFSSARSILLVDRLEPDPDKPDPMDLGAQMMITQDPPRHDRLKALVLRAFTPKRVLGHTERIREIINLVYDRALEAHPDGRLDLVQDVGIYVPAMVIGDMLGAPREDAEKLVNWTNRTTAFEDPRLVPDFGELQRALEEFVPYVDAMITEREAHPTDDLTTAFIQAEVEGERLSGPAYLTNVGGTLFFRASDSSHGAELWKSDGTATGTKMVKDIYPGSGTSIPQDLTNVGGTLFFGARDPSHGFELWKSNGTAAGTKLVKDINPGSGDSNPVDLTSVAGTLFFSATNPNHGYELWRSDGTSAGTSIVQDINWDGDGNPQFLTNLGGTLFFSGTNPSTGTELWKAVP